MSDCADGPRLTISTGYELLLRANGLDSVAALFADNLGERLDKPGLASWRQRRRVILSSPNHQVTMFLKRFEHAPRDARRLVRESRTGARTVAGLEWEWLQRLRRDGISAPRPVALCEELSGGRELRSALMMEGVGGRSLERMMPEWGTLERRKRREILVGTAWLVGRLHRFGYIHRDLYLSHIFCDPAEPSGAGLNLIDVQRVIRPGWLRRRWVVKDLAALQFSAPDKVVSRTDRLRWLRAYLEIGKLDAHARRLAYRVIGKSASIARRERRRSRAAQQR